MRFYSLRLLTLISLLAASQLVARGEAILDQLPAEATAFVAVRHLAATSEKIERLTKIFQDLTPDPLPAPLELVKGVTGIGDGLDEEGDALLALLPGEEGPLPARPLLLLPVTDYATFAASVGGDATGEICRVAIAGEEVLLAQRGTFAALMNVEHRDLLEIIIATKPNPPLEFESMTEWLATTDVSAGLTSAGLGQLTAARRTDPASAQGREASAMLLEIQQMMQFYDAALNLFEAKVKAGVVGVSIDDDANLKIAKRILFADKNVNAEIASATPLAASPLAGFPSGPFVVAGGGPTPPGYSEILARASRRFLAQLPKGTGYEGFTEDDWKLMEESYQESMKGVTSTAFVFYPGAKDEGLLSNYYFKFDVVDSAEYLTGYRKSIELTNDLVARAGSDFSPTYEMRETTVADKPAIEGMADIAAAAADPNVPMVEPMLKAMFGPDGKMRITAVAANHTTAIIGVAAQDELAKLVTYAVSGEKGLAGDASIESTVQLLDQQAPWIVLLSPQGIVQWATRWTESFFAGMAGGFKIPPFPATPPLGFSIRFTESELHGEAVITVDVLKSTAKYIEELQGK